MTSMTYSQQLRRLFLPLTDRADVSSPKAGEPAPGYCEEIRQGLSQDFFLEVYPDLRPLYMMFLLEIIGFGMTVPIITFFILEDMGLDTFHLGSILAAFSMAQVFGSIVFGRVSDACGRWPVVVFCFVWCAVGFFATAFVRNFMELFVTRTLAGLSGGTWPIVQAYVLDVLVPWHRSKYLGLLGATFALGMGIGPGLSAALRYFELVTRRQVFALSGVVCAIGAALGILFLKESLPPEKRRPIHCCGKPPEAEDSEQGGSPSPQSTAAHLSDWEALNLGLTLVWWARFALSFGQFCFYSMYGPLIKDLYGYRDTELGIILMLMGTWGVVVQTFVFPAWTRVMGRRKTLAFSCFCFSIGLFLIPLQVPLLMHTLTMLLIGLGGGLSEPSFPNVLAAYASPSHLGFANGVLSSCRGVAAVGSPLVSGALYKYCGACAFNLAGVLALISGFVVMAMCFFATELEVALHVTPRNSPSLAEKQPTSYTDPDDSDLDNTVAGRGNTERSGLLNKGVKK
eukprot:TRINITY_DN11438_c0_g1_i1.p1 TRINITY_DN11438_c0_g1~~TRINITY_DN11438_c0_g1_i1.p1  ORF type:complete len:512 (-),score=52.36 TRINITY_DN11438_c0_g1_i1:80-1615(-)